MTGADISRLETHLGRLLLGGVVSSATCLTAGLALWLTGVVPSIAHALLTAGLMILMATPILRVVVSVAEYTLMRDWFFATTTLVVLIVLAVTIGVAVYGVKAG